MSILFRTFKATKNAVRRSKKIRVIKKHYNIESNACFVPVFSKESRKEWLHEYGWGLHLMVDKFMVKEFEDGTNPGLQTLKMMVDWMQGMDVPVSLVYYQEREAYALQYITSDDLPIYRVLFDLSLLRIVGTYEFNWTNPVFAESPEEYFWRLDQLAAGRSLRWPGHFPCSGYHSMLKGSFLNTNRPKPAKTQFMYSAYYFFTHMYTKFNWDKHCPTIGEWRRGFLEEPGFVDRFDMSYRITGLQTTGLDVHHYLDIYGVYEDKINTEIVKYGELQEEMNQDD